jgi:hypothetical protein
VPIGRYLASDEHFGLRGDVTRTFDSRTPLATVENELLAPLFRYTKTVKVFDRWIGGSYDHENHRRFRESIAWLYHVFSDCSKVTGRRRFEVTTGVVLPSANSYAATQEWQRARAAARELAAFAKREQEARSDNPTFTIVVKQDSHGEAGLEHDRYLSTDQTLLLISRGFDLLRKDGKSTNQFSVSTCSVDPGSVERSFSQHPTIAAPE